MTDIRTPRLQLHPIDAAEGERIVDGAAGGLEDYLGVPCELFRLPGGS